MLVSATKGATGHLLGAAGAVEAAFTVLTLARGVPPPTLNLDQPEPNSMGYEHVVLGRARGEGRPLRAALCNAFGFGGMNASALFVAIGARETRCDTTASCWDAGQQVTGKSGFQDAKFKVRPGI